MQECKAQYKADHAGKGIPRTWVDYQVKRCGIDPSPPAAAKTCCSYETLILLEVIALRG
jgi:hypothetical protein